MFEKKTKITITNTGSERCGLEFYTARRNVFVRIRLKIQTYIRTHNMYSCMCIHGVLHSPTRIRYNAHNVHVPSPPSQQPSSRILKPSRRRTVVSNVKPSARECVLRRVWAAAIGVAAHLKCVFSVAVVMPAILKNPDGLKSRAQESCRWRGICDQRFRGIGSARARRGKRSRVREKRRRQRAFCC